MSRTLQPEDQIAQYTIVGPLGAGGMGEVYIARDGRLDRDVALKVLPPRLVRDEGRVRRFITEAKSASSLNHPNIVTIHDIGHDEVRSTDAGDGEPGSEPIHFITMELVSGDTLGGKIHKEKAELRSLVGWLAQAAEGIAKAHAAGIVHRDLKPANIMVSGDGFAKVLDFGLAKLTEKVTGDEEALTSAPTEEKVTGKGVVLGTVGYMSPEQVQGKSVDHRSDIFSLGCILYEAATRRRPFAADTDVEVMHRILKERPKPVEELNPEAPAEIRRIIRRCLAKSPDQRFQTMKDVAIELREAVEAWDSLSPSGGSDSFPGALPSGVSGTPPAMSAGARAGVAALAVLGLAGIAFGIYSLSGRSGPSAAREQSSPMTYSVLMSGNDFGIRTSRGRNPSGGAALSADGRYLAYTTFAGGRSSLNVRQVRTGSDVEILPPQESTVYGISFSPDGDYLHYLQADPDHPHTSSLFRVPSLGGAPEKVAIEVATEAAFSPDGRLACFWRSRSPEGVDSLVIADLESGEERDLIRVTMPEQLDAPPAWSPDGRRVATAIFTLKGGLKAWVVSVDVESGESTRVGDQTWIDINSLGWSRDGDAILLSAFLFGPGHHQIHKLSWPGGQVERLTSDLDGYTNVSVSGTENTMAAVRTSDIDNIWVAPADGAGQPKAITSSTSSANSIGGMAPLADGGIAFSFPQGKRNFLARMNADGSERRTINTKGEHIFEVDSARGDEIFFWVIESTEKIVTHLWAVNADGTGLRQLTNGGGELPGRVSPAETHVLYFAFDDRQLLWAQELDGGEPYMLTEARSVAEPVFSPHGTKVLLTVAGSRDGRNYPLRQILPIEGGEPEKSFFLPPGLRYLTWSPDGRSLTYLDRDSGWNIHLHPVGEGKAEPITNLDEGRIMSFRWSPDGRHIAYLHRIDDNDRLWVLDPDSGENRLITEFETGRIREGFRWALDSRSLVFRHGTTNQDVVMISGF